MSHSFALSSNPLVDISQGLSESLKGHKFHAPAEFVYDPTAYAREVHQHYLVRYGKAPKITLLLGINPGPYGMAQTGVPFGDVTFVKEFLELHGAVEVPSHNMHPKKTIQGFQLKRKEVSGTRFWGWIRERWNSPDYFFESNFVWSYCPLLFLTETGRNLVPEKLVRSDRDFLYAHCDAALRKVVDTLEVAQIVAIGKFAEKRAKKSLGKDFRIIPCPHPSPANPLTNQGWDELADDALAELLP